MRTPGYYGKITEEVNNLLPSADACGEDLNRRVYVPDLDTWTSIWPLLPFQD